MRSPPRKRISRNWWQRRWHARLAIAATAAALARIDVAAGQAERAAEGGWCLPHIAEEPVLEIEGGRHPVVEAALAAKGERFIANDCRACARTTGCGWSAGRTWAANRPSCARTR